MEYKTIRRSQYISPFGVGAIYDFSGESMIAADINKWAGDYGEILRLKRLESRLNIKYFKAPSTYNKFNSTRINIKYSIPFERFPKWLFCKICRQMVYWGRAKEVENKIPMCKKEKCNNKKLTPMRFVMACEKGHIEDIDWRYWVHSYKTSTNDACKVHDQLEFKSKENSSGASLATVSCRACGASRAIKGISQKKALTSIGIKCRGRQPWERADKEVKCDGEVRAIQRGASNLYYPKLISALDIPIESSEPSINEELNRDIKNSPFYKQILRKISSATGTNIDKVVDSYADIIVEEVTGCSREYILKLAKDDLFQNEDAVLSNQITIDEKEILLEEWGVLSNPNDNNKDFSAQEEILGNDIFGLESVLDKLVLVKKLREVRVLRGFHRITPSKEDFVQADLNNNVAWLPATEVFGEGIFISFKEKAITTWQNKYKDAIDHRLDVMQKKYNHMELDFLPEPTPKFVLLHTLAHLLIRQLAFECGYAAASLRERIYCSDEKNPMAGILIYTADSDSEGSLGGLVRQGNKDRFIPTLLTAMQRGEWCSADPVCRELPAQGMNGLNRAACHSCSLLAETSCVSHNALLDRMLLFGHDEKYKNYGFFKDLIDKYLQESTT